MSSLLDRYRGLPRAGQWGVLAVGALLAFVVWDESERYRSSFAERAEAAASEVERYESRLERMRRGGGAVGRSVERHGEVAGPGEFGERQAAMGDLLTSIASEERLGDGWRYDSSTSPLRETEVGSIFPAPRAGMKVERLVYTLIFESDAGTATSVVRRLEGSPLVVSVPSVTMRVADRGGERVSVRVEAETWVFAGGGRRGGA